MSETQGLKAIIAGCKSGDSESFSRLLDLYADKCYGYFYRMTGNRDISDELLSELFAKLVTKIKTYKGEGFNGWIFKVTGNVFFDYLRDKYREKKKIEAAAEVAEFEIQGAGIEEDERVDDVQKQLAKLDDDTRELIMLRFYSGLSFKDIGELREQPVGTILSKVHRGLNKLRKLMGEKKND